MFWYVAAFTLAAVVAALALVLRREIRTETFINADPQRVWQVLTDGKSYASWNPLILSMKGEIASGARLENVLAAGPERRITFRPVILALRENRELRWLGRVIVPRIFDGEHYFLLEPQGDGTRLVHGEIFRGIALALGDPEQFRAGFDAMNLALKHRVEAAAGVSAAPSARID